MLNQKRPKKGTKFALMVFRVRDDYIFRNLQHNVLTTRVKLLALKSRFAGIDRNEYRRFIYM